MAAQKNKQGDQEQVKFVLRLPPALHKKIKRNARLENRSMNTYIWEAMTEHVKDEQGKAKTLAGLIKRMEMKGLI